jgi:YD repeat-containing protein
MRILGMRPSRVALTGAIVLVAVSAGLLAGGHARAAKHPSAVLAAIARQQRTHPSDQFAHALAEFPSSRRTTVAVSRHLPGARGHSPVTKIGARVKWLDKANSNTYVAGSGHLATKVYPLAVNYRTRKGAFSTINPRLVRAGHVLRERANNLGVRVPMNANRALHVGGRGRALSIKLAGASGAGHLAGMTETYGRVEPGVSLRYKSSNAGIGFSARVDSARAARSMRWVVRGSAGLRARVVHGQAQFRTKRGRIVDELTAPAVHTASGKAVPVRLALARRRGLTTITIYPLGVTTATPAQTTPAGGVHPDILQPPAGPPGFQAGYPIWEDGAWITGGDIYTTGPTLDDAGETTGDCDLNSAAPNTASCGAATVSVGPKDHALLNFDVTQQLPDHVQILDSFVTMHVKSESKSSTEELGAWASDKSWTTSATWNKYDGTHAWPTAGGDLPGDPTDEQYVGTGDDIGNWLYWDIDAPLQRWIDQKSPAQGIEIAPMDGASAPTKIGFDTTTSAANYPYIFVIYQPRVGTYAGAHYASQRLTDKSSLGVNVASGNLMVTNHDLRVPGVAGLDLDVDRTYNDLSSDQGSFGLGWTMSGADTYLAVESDERDTLFYNNGSGNLQSFYQDLSGNWVAPPGNDAVLSMNNDSSADSTEYTMVFRHSGMTETFDTPDGSDGPIDTMARLTKVTDRNGNTLTYTYSDGDLGQLQSIQDSHGATTTFEYDAAGYIDKMTGPSGGVSHYTQNDAGELISYEDPASNTTNYAYDDFGNLTQITTPAGNVVQASYDAGDTDRATSVTRLVDPVDTTGPTTSFSYGAPDGTTCAATTGDTETQVTDPRAHQTTDCLDDLGRLISSKDPDGNVASTSYTADGYVASTTDPRGITTSYGYANDGSDNLTSLTRTGTGSGAPTLTESLAYGDAANQYLPTQVTDPQANDLNYAYNGNGDPTSVSEPSTGISSQATYNSDGTIAASIDADGHETDYGYTGGNLTSVTPPSGSGQNTLALTWDAKDRVSSISSVAGGSGHEVDYTYDGLDRVTQALYKNASGATAATIGYSYDNDGDLLTRADPAGTTTWTYDGLDRPLTEALPDAANYTYGWNDSSDLTSLHDAGGTVTYAYDPANLATAITDPGAATATALTYNADGDLTNVAYPSGVSVARSYNSLDQLQQVTNTYLTSSGSNATLSQALTYTGDLPHTMTDQAGNTTTYSYDALNRLTEADGAADGGSGGPTTTNYSYDTNGRLTEADTTSGTDYHYAYDSDGNLLQSTTPAGVTSYAYNPAGEICWSITGSSSNACDSPPGGANAFSYDADGNETGNGNGLAIAYNALDQATSITTGTGTESLGYLGEGHNHLASDGGTPVDQGVLGIDTIGTGASASYFARTPDGQLVDERTGSGTYNYLFEANGSVVGLTNSSGHLVNQYSYDPKGNQTVEVAAVTNPFGYRGDYTTSSGLLLDDGRYLDPDSDSYTQPTNALIASATQSPYADPTHATRQAAAISPGIDPVTSGLVRSTSAPLLAVTQFVRPGAEWCPAGHADDSAEPPGRSTSSSDPATSEESSCN